MNRRLFTSVLFACLLPFMVQAQQAVFRFAQLTDIHLSPNNPNPTEDLLRSIAQINATDSIDFVLVTGDIAEEGDRTTMEKVKSCLDLLKVKYYVALGNHETKWSDSGCTAFGEIFGGERFEFRPADAYGIRPCRPSGYPLDDGNDGVVQCRQFPAGQTCNTCYPLSDDGRRCGQLV